jgi:RNA polymerase II subunit A-like phosphatase
LFRYPGRAGVIDSTTTAHIPIIHTVPQLRVSKTEAQEIAGRDEGRLLQQRKLVLIVDLDQTLIHTTVDPSIEPGLKDVYGFKLPGYPHFYHCRLRPGAKDFVCSVSEKYEMHVFTLGGRDYAHTVAGILDPEEKFFARRVLSRDELLDQNLKTTNLRAFFPIDDSMVVIIDDREDVWSSVPNLIVVKPYQFFKGAGDIHSPTDSTEASTRHIMKKEKARTEMKDSVPEKPVLPSVDTSQKEGQIKTSEDNQLKEITESPDDDKSSHSSLSRSSSQSSVSSSDSDSKTEDKPNGAQKEEKDKEATIQPSLASETVTEASKSKEKIIVRSPGRKHSHALNKAMLALEDSDKDNYLNYLSETLCRIHSTFYEEFDQMGNGSPYPDVREIIPHMRNRVLQGVNIVFSSVFPINVIQPENHPIWRLAISLGATVSTNIIAPKEESMTNPVKKQKCEGLVTTHVVAAKNDTFKVHQARKLHGIYLVSPDWLWCCGERWEWVDEKLFPVDDLPVAIDLSDHRLVRPGSQETEKVEKTVMTAARHGERLVSREDLAEMDREVAEELGSDNLSSNSEESLDSTTQDQASNGFLVKMAGSLSPSDAESEGSSENGENGRSSSDEDDMAALLDAEISHF